MSRNGTLVIWLGIVALFLAGHGTSHAALGSHIGLFSDESASYCGASTTPYTTVSVYVIAVVESDISGISAVEFAIDNIPSGMNGMVTPYWESSLTIGEIETGIAIAFGQIQYDSEVILGRLDFMPLDDTWLPADHRLIVKEADATGNIAIVDEYYTEHYVQGGRFTFNCSSSENCECGLGSSQDATWGEVKSLY